MWNPFRKNQNTEVVHPSDGIHAKERLRRRVRFDVDEFLSRETDDVLFRQPLGPTRHCLSITQIGDLVEGTLRENEPLQHVAHCKDCRREIDNYRDLTEQDWAAVAGIIIESSAIRIPQGGRFYLVLANHGEAGLLSGIDPSSIVVAGAIDARGCRISPIKRAGNDVAERVELHFDHFKVNAPEGQKEICNWLELEGRTKSGKLRKREFVRVLQEAFA
jgi:hypothetical protein